jgi:hypothetical protein
MFCGYCAAPLARAGSNPVSPEPKPGGNPPPAPPVRGSSSQPKASPPPNPFKPEIRTPIIHSTPPQQPPPPPPNDINGGSRKGKGGGGFELIPWSELSAGQRLGRAFAAAIVLILILFFIRGILRGVVGGTGSGENAPTAESSAAPITDGDRTDGINSLCKVFQIYGLPKNDHDATEDARNAGELFKLAGNQSPERSEYILTSVVGEFRSGKLGQADCSQAGEPLPTTEQTQDNSTPDIQRDNGQP